MTRIALLFAAFSAPSLLLMDSAAKGTVLLILAAIAVLCLRRDSSATRHLVWLLAMVAMLIVPAMSALLPEWRVLPRWANVASRSIELMPSQPVEIPSSPNEPDDSAVRFDDEQSLDEANAPPAADRIPTSATVPAKVAAQPDGWAGWFNCMPLVWAIGFGVLILRLVIARLMLWRTERRSIALGTSGQSNETERDPLVAALDAACKQIGIGRSITLRVHSEKTIPLVWGIFRYRLMLPAAAREWSDEQLKSVLMHELAHLKRGDTIAQLLTQIACAIHWFNPFIWAAAWRIGVERERACDDLVLASGIRASTYAGHLLEIVTGLPSIRWTHACGLAFARKSSLEGRLIAVLSKNLNRRETSVALLAAAFVIAAGIVVPISMLRAADDKPANAQQAAETTKDGSKLEPEMEEHLQWGKPVNGLRAALTRPRVRGAAEDEHFDFELVVQNVSEAPVRINTVGSSTQQRTLRVRKDDRTLFGLHDEKFADVDYRLQPGEVAVLKLFPPTQQGAHVSGDDPSMTFLAELKVENVAQGVWSGTLKTADTSGIFTAYGRLPKQKDAQELYKQWNAIARGDEKIPGGMIGLLTESIQTFTKNNPTWETTPQLKKMLPRLDATRDWTGPEALALLDELAALQSTPISMALQRNNVLRKGSALPPELTDAPWGPADPSGLRLAWLLEPRSKEHRLGTPLKSRLLIHNSGKVPAVFRTGSWHQEHHTARDANGKDLEIDSVEWTTLSHLQPFRLAPGEFVELPAAGIGVGKDKSDDDWQNVRVGSWIKAAVGDDVTVTTGPILLSGRNEKDDGEVPQWWHDFIAERVARHLPLPDGQRERERILYRIAMELFVNPVSAEENAALVNDHEPKAVESLVDRLAKSDRVNAFVGSLESAPTRFRVLPPDPDAAKRPRSASNPGHYRINGNVVLFVSRRPLDERIVNEARVTFYSSDPKKPAPAEPYTLKLPDGYDTWAVAWVRGESLLWLQEKDAFRSYNFANPAKVSEEVVDRKKVPLQVREALHKALTALEPKSPPKPENQTKTPPAASMP